MERHDIELMSSKKRRLDSSISGDTSNPNGDGSSKVIQSESAVVKFVDNVVYRLYFKGLVSDEMVVDGGEKTVKSTEFGVAICDEMDKLLYEVKESLSDAEISRKGVEIMALIRGLSESFDLGSETL